MTVEVFIMKKLLVSLVLSLALCLTLAVGAFADVASPRPAPKPDDKPNSPQTGYEMGIGSVAAAAVLCGGIAVVTGKKSRD